MHDHVAVRVIDGATDLHEEREPVGDGQRAIAAVAIDRHAVDQLHDEVRMAVRRAAAIEQARDPRMREVREDLALLLEAPVRIIGDPWTQQL